MHPRSHSAQISSAALGLLVAIVAIVAIAWFVSNRASWPRGEALTKALEPTLESSNSDQALVAKAILDNYGETRRNASRWSGIYWSFTFLAAALSAFAGLILKSESIFRDEKIKKDVAALFAVVAAVLITISTSGDFQRKWQANRIVAAELERIGYEFLQTNGANARAHFATIGQILHTRHVSIVGGSDVARNAPGREAAPIAP